MSHRTTLTPADFEHPWADLHERLTRADEALAGLMSNQQGTDNEIRLAWKRDALTHATSVWDRLNDRISLGDLDHAGAWRMFTDRVAALFGTLQQDNSPVHPGYYEGVAVALSYQRGYGEGIDAPVILNPHLTKD